MDVVSVDNLKRYISHVVNPKVVHMANCPHFDDTKVIIGKYPFMNLNFIIEPHDKSFYVSS